MIPIWGNYKNLKLNNELKDCSWCTPYANEMEFLLKKSKVELVKFGRKPVKGANGEDLIPIKLRVVGYKWKERNILTQNI